MVQVGIEDGNKEYGPMEKVWKKEDYLKFRQIMKYEPIIIVRLGTLEVKTFIHLGFYTWAQEHAASKDCHYIARILSM